MSSKIRIVLVDDEKDSLDILKLMLEDIDCDLEVVGVAENVEKGIILIQQTNPDLVFLDIRMPDGSGFDLLDRIQNIKFDVVFVTAYDEYALKAFEFNAIHYLLKPVDLGDVNDAIKRHLKSNNSIFDEKLENLKKYIKNDIEKIVLPSSDGLQVVKLDDILWLEADGPYTIFHIKNKNKLVVSKSLNTYQELLEDKCFIRTHNKFVVNLKYVKRFSKGSGGEIEMENGTMIGVSVRKKQDFLSKLKDYTLNKY